YIDVSHIASGDLETGIQRVVKQVVSSLYTGKFVGFTPIAVELKDGELYEAKPWLNEKGLLAPCEAYQDIAPLVEFARGDILLMLDSSWERYSEFHPVFDEARLAQVPVITAIYDILPVTLPPACFVRGGPQWFEGWLQNAVEASDALVCISRATADEVIGYIEKNMPEKKDLKVGYWHLGSNLGESQAKGKTSERVQKVIQKPYLLVVGTIEPRKSHALILDSMELLWKQGIELNLCIAGKEGWKSEDLVERLRSHPELGKRLFFIEKPDDKEIIDLYKNASGLIFLSLGEGFGLPIVEAAHYGVPVICSDLPVFREVAGEYATYVKIDTAEKVSRDILKWWDKSKSKTLPDITNMPLLTWEESAKQLLKVVFENNWYWRK
ncbi:MAG: glycosyltransferase family 4 protein, partial [Thermodesulfobacteriota bacterium]